MRFVPGSLASATGPGASPYAVACGVVNVLAPSARVVKPIAAPGPPSTGDAARPHMTSKLPVDASYAAPKQRNSRVLRTVSSTFALDHPLPVQTVAVRWPSAP